MGGLPVVVDVALTSTGITASAGSLALPEGHSWHENDAGRPVPRGKSTIPFATVTLPANATDIAKLVADLKYGFLHAGALPFTLNAISLTVTQSVVGGKHKGGIWAYDLPFGVNDSRRPGTDGIARVRTNDIRYALGKGVQPRPNFTLTAGGLSAIVDFKAGEGDAHYPQIHLGFAGSRITVRDGELRDKQALAADTAHVFTQSADCESCAHPAAADVAFATTPIAANMGLGRDGTILSKDDGLSNPGWGTYEAARGHVFERVADDGLSGVLHLPGFEVLGSANTNVPSVLLGVRQPVSGAGGVVYPGKGHALGSTPATLGNYYPAGLTVGPERYSVSGVPQVGTGLSLAGSGTRVLLGGVDASPACGGVDCEVIANLGTRYVVRPAGVTGVFNTDTAPDPTVYGYEIALNRFAWRQTVNAIDPNAWMDGSVAIPEPGGFSPSFSSLGLACTGHLGDVPLIPCPEGGEAPAPNCGLSLMAWQTAIELLSMRFEPPAGTDACAEGDRTLEVGTLTDIKALDDRLQLTATWNPDGTPTDTLVSGATDNVLDSTSGVGFGLALHPDLQLVSVFDGGVWNGWFEFDADFAVSFWDSLTGRLRLENASTTSRERTVVVAETSTLDFATVDPDDADLLATMKNEALTAHYTWGDTGFNLDLPVYYDTDGSTSPAFTGIKLNHDLVVFKIDAAADYITPTESAVSFGASADIDALKLAEIDLHIDINDPESIAAIDALLAEHFGIMTSPIGSLIDPIRTKLQALLDSVQASLEGQIELAIRGVLGAAFDALPASIGFDSVLDEAADLIATITALPATFSSAVTAALDDTLDALLAPLSGTMELTAKAAIAATIGIYVNAPTAVCGTGPTDLPCDALYEALSQLHEALGAVTGALDAAGTTLDVTRATVSSTVAWAGDIVAQARTVVQDIKHLVFEVNPTLVALASGNVSDNPVLGLMLDSLAPSIGDLLGELGVIDLLGALEPIAAYVSVALDLVGLSEADIIEDALVLVADLAAAEASFTTDAATSAFAGVLDAAKGFLDDLDTALADVESDLGSVEAAVLGALDGLEVALDDARDQVGRVDAFLVTLESDIRCAVDPACPNSPLEGLTGIQVTVGLAAGFYAATDGRATLLIASGDTFVTGLADSLREPIDIAVAQVSAEVAAGLPSIGDLPAIRTAVELQDVLIDLVMDTDAIESMMITFDTYFNALADEAVAATNAALDVVNDTLQKVAEAIEDVANDLIAAANATIEDVTSGINLPAAAIDGYAVFNGDELAKAHVGLELTMEGDDPETSSVFEIALDVESYDVVGKGDACAGDGEAKLDATLSTGNIPITIGTGTITIETAELGFILDGDGNRPKITGVHGGITTSGSIGFGEMEVYDIGFQAGVGTGETYLGATAGARFSAMALSVTFLVGKTCNADVLAALDPQAADFIDLTSGFNGAYVRGTAAIPIVDFGCAFNLSVTCDVGTWILKDPGTGAFIFGGLVGGGGSGKLGCIGALAGKLIVYATLNGDDLGFGGEGFAAAGVGLACDPETWTTVEKSRDDKSCGTGDATFGAEFDSGSWIIAKPSVSAVH